MTYENELIAMIASLAKPGAALQRSPTRVPNVRNWSSPATKRSETIGFSRLSSGAVIDQIRTASNVPQVIV